MPGAFPSRRLLYWQYSPLISVGCLFWWITGLGLWIHYTQTAYNKSLDTIDILQISTNKGVSSQVSRVASSLIATATVFCFFAICIHALAIWRGFITSDQDTTGQVDATKATFFMYGNVAVQVAWWIIVIWMIAMVVGYGAFSAFIYTARTALTNIMVLQLLLPGSAQGPSIAGYCPVSCLSTVSTGIFTYLEETPVTASPLCLCDRATLEAAQLSIQGAFNAVPGMLVGVLVMLVYGVVLLVYLTSMLIRCSMEQDISERLTQQGFSSNSLVKSGGGGGGGRGGARY